MIHDSDVASLGWGPKVAGEAVFYARSQVVGESRDFVDPRMAPAVNEERACGDIFWPLS